MKASNMTHSAKKKKKKLYDSFICMARIVPTSHSWPMKTMTPERLL